MRVISGIYKGRKLLAPPENVRPTLDRVRETLFDIIQFDVPGSVFFDLFAGSGANGIEAMSRGAKEVIFCDNGRQNIKILEQNLSFTSGAKVLTCDFRDGLKKFAPQTFDIIFIDPPFNSDYGEIALRQISERKLLKDDGVAIWEHPRGNAVPQTIDDLSLVRKKEVGSVGLSFYKKTEDN